MKEEVIMAGFQFSPRLMRAIERAAIAHEPQYRKKTSIPYVSHLYGVMHIVSQAEWGAGQRASEDMLIAALFHDILEDVPEQYSREQMREEFGDSVVDMVTALTKNDAISSWRERNEDYLRHLIAVGNDGAVVIACADKLYNLMSMIDDAKKFGPSSWDRFNGDLDEQKWWFGALADAVRERLPELNLLDELDRQVAILRQAEAL